MVRPSGHALPGDAAGEQHPEGHFIGDANLDDPLSSPAAQESGRRPSVSWSGKTGHG
jgi:hypothetical protein